MGTAHHQQHETGAGSPRAASGDEAVAEQIRHHHAQMVAELTQLAVDLRDAALEGRDSAPARAAFVAWIDRVLLPHAREEEEGTYAAAAVLPEGTLLIEAMQREHALMRSMADVVRDLQPPLAAAAWARALSATFTSHQATENEVILPLLVSSEAVDLAAVAGHLG